MFEGSKITNMDSYKIHKGCAVILSQKFEENKSYEISYKWNGGKCYADLSEIKRNKAGVAEKVLLQKRTSALNGEFSDACMKTFKKFR